MGDHRLYDLAVIGAGSAGFSAMVRACDICVCSALVFIDGTRSLSQLSLKCAASPVNRSQPVRPLSTFVRLSAGGKRISN